MISIQRIAERMFYAISDATISTFGLERTLRRNGNEILSTGTIELVSELDDILGKRILSQAQIDTFDEMISQTFDNAFASKALTELRKVGIKTAGGGKGGREKEETRK